MLEDKTVCMKYSIIKSAQECKRAAAYARITFTDKQFFESDARGPKGCSWSSVDGGMLIFNRGIGGEGKPDAAPLCVKGEG